MTSEPLHTSTVTMVAPKDTKQTKSKTQDFDELSSPSAVFGGALRLAQTIDSVSGGSKTLAQILGVAQPDLDRCYRAASRLLQKKQYDKAADAFLYLTALNPSTHSYWVNLGLAEQLRGRLQEAIDAYGIAAITDLSDPIPHVYAAECYLALDRLDCAVDTLQIAVKFGADEASLGAVKAQLINITRQVQARCRSRQKASSKRK